MADNLESYFKKHLSDDTPAKDNWNVPSDDVWEKVLPEIQRKGSLFPGNIYTLWEELF